MQIKSSHEKEKPNLKKTQQTKLQWPYIKK